MEVHGRRFTVDGSQSTVRGHWFAGAVQARRPSADRPDDKGFESLHCGWRLNVRLVHYHDGETRVLASDVHTADTVFSQVRGLMFRRSVPPGYALVFRFCEPDRHGLHMLFVPFAIDALWLVGDEVTRKKRLRPWVGVGVGTADTIVELPAGTAADVREGDVVVFEEDSAGEPERRSARR